MSLVRDFTSGGAIRTLIGNCDTTGAFTWVGYMRFTESSTGWIIARQDSGFAGASNWMSFGREGGQLVAYPSGNSGINPPNSKWVLVVLTKEVGTNPIVFYYYDFSTKTWTKSETAPTTVAHSGTPTRLQFGKWNSGEQFNGLYAAAAIFESHFSPAEVHALAEVSFIEDWLTLTPAGMWIFDQEAANKEVVDLTGNGADGSEEMQLVGTSATEVLLPIAYREGEETGEEEGGEEPPSEHTVKVKVGGSVVTAKRWVKSGGILVPA